MFVITLIFDEKLPSGGKFRTRTHKSVMNATVFLNLYDQNCLSIQFYCSSKTDKNFENRFKFIKKSH